MELTSNSFYKHQKEDFFSLVGEKFFPFGREKFLLNEEGGRKSVLCFLIFIFVKFFWISSGKTQVITPPKGIIVFEKLSGEVRSLHLSMYIPPVPIGYL